MKKTWKASSGFLPRRANNRNPTTRVAATANSVDSQLMRRDGSGRASSLTRIGQACGRSVGPRDALCTDERTAHQKSDVFGVGFTGGSWWRESAARDDREAVADLEQFVELFGDDQNGHALIAQIDQGLA